MSKYPQILIEIAEKSLPIFNEVILENDINIDIFKETVCEKLFPKYINGDKLTFNADDVVDVMNISNNRSKLKFLIDQGLVDILEDENGNQLRFLTEKGKERLSKIENAQEKINNL